MLFKFIICFLAGIGAGLGTGFAGMSNIVFLMLLYRPLGSKLKRMQEKFGVLASGKNT